MHKKPTPEQIGKGIIEKNETHPNFDIQAILENYENNQIFKKRYIEKIKQHETDEEIILEVLVKNNGLKHNYIPTIEQHDSLKFLTAGQYPNAKNIIHSTGIYGGQRENSGFDYTDLDMLDKTFLAHSSSIVTDSEENKHEKLEHASFFCSPWNSLGVGCGLKFIFKPEDLTRFLGDLIKKYFNQDIETFMTREIKKILNNSNNFHFANSYQIINWSDNRPYECNENTSPQDSYYLKTIYEKEIANTVLKQNLSYDDDDVARYPNTTCAETSNFTSIDRLHLFEKSDQLKTMSYADKQAFINLILYAVPKYLTLIYNEKQTKKFVNKNDIEIFKKQDEEIEWSFVGRNSYNNHGFILFTEDEDNKLKFSDASIVLSFDDIKSQKYNINTNLGETTQRVIFRFKK
ncbi:MAG: hypothetical protein ABIF17_00880 [Patescibacteria group bacterium]